MLSPPVLLVMSVALGAMGEEVSSKAGTREKRTKTPWDDEHVKVAVWTWLWSLSSYPSPSPCCQVYFITSSVCFSLSPSLHQFNLSLSLSLSYVHRLELPLHRHTLGTTLTITVLPRRLGLSEHNAEL